MPPCADISSCVPRSVRCGVRCLPGLVVYIAAFQMGDSRSLGRRSTWSACAFCSVYFRKSDCFRSKVNISVVRMHSLDKGCSYHWPPRTTVYSSSPPPPPPPLDLRDRLLLSLFRAFLACLSFSHLRCRPMSLYAA